MGDVLPNRKSPDAAECDAVPKDEAPTAYANVLPHPDRTDRLESGIKDLSERFPAISRRAAYAILGLVERLSGGDHKLDHRRAEALKVNLIRALSVLEAIHQRPESVSKDELESLKQAMLQLYDVQHRESRTRHAAKGGRPDC